MALAMLVVGVLLRRGFRGTQRKVDAQNDHNAQQAAGLGMTYTAPMADAPVTGSDDTTHRYTGTTNAVPWVLEALVLADQHIMGERYTGGEGQRPFTRWTAPQAGTGGGFLLLMNLRGGAQAAPPAAPSAEGGLMAALVDKTAALALQTYARMAFGGGRAQPLALGQHHHQSLAADDFGTAFRAFGDRPELLQRLTSNAREWLLRAHRWEVAVLWDTHGLTLRWPSARVTPEQVAACAEFGATLVGLMKRVDGDLPPAPGGS